MVTKQFQIIVIMKKITPILNNVVFESKRLRNSKNNQLTISDYGLKFNLKRENKLDKDDSIVRELLRDWQSIPKTFRYKKTFTFKDTSLNYKIDLSIVKSSSQSDQYLSIREIEEKKLFKKVIKPKSVISPFSEWWSMISKNKDEKVLVQNLDLMYKNIQESRVFTNKPIYEVEVEYIKNKQPNFKIPKFTKIQEKKDYLNNEFQNFFKYIGIILQCIQNSFFIMSYKEKHNFSNQFQLMLKKIVKNNEDKFKVNEKDNISKLIKFYPNRLFFGPLAVDLTHDKIGHFDADKLTNDQIVQITILK